MRALNGSLTEPMLPWHFNRKRGKEELGVGAGGPPAVKGSLCRAFVFLHCHCPLRPISRAVGPESHHHPSPNLPTRRDIHRTEYGHR